jgi:hypothetical protein
VKCHIGRWGSRGGQAARALGSATWLDPVSLGNSGSIESRSSVPQLRLVSLSRGTVVSAEAEMTQDLKTRMEKLSADAADCDLIASSATELRKRATFRRLAEQFRRMAAELKGEIAAAEKAQRIE